MTASTYLRACSASLLAHQGPPPIEAFERALEAYDAEVDAVRAEGLTRTLPGDAAERFFAIGFSLEQMHQNLRDLAARGHGVERRGVRSPLLRQVRAASLTVSAYPACWRDVRNLRRRGIALAALALPLPR